MKATKVEKELQALRAKVAELEKKEMVGTLSFAVAPKGGVSVYGLQRWPLTLYANQWERLFDSVEAIRGFINENRSKLSVKKPGVKNN